MNALEYITTAMVAWDEIWQGYPDHWIKVHGNLVEASQSTNGQISNDLLCEAMKFLDSYKNHKKYRPCFEKLACNLLNKLAKKNIVQENMILDSQLCYDCATKHLAEAQVSYNQMNKDPRAWVLVIGNLSHAANHLVEKHPNLSNIIREMRKDFMDQLMFEKTHSIDVLPLIERIRSFSENYLYGLTD